MSRTDHRITDVHVDFHRNGIGGEPFYAVLFTAQIGPEEAITYPQRFLATLGQEPYQTHVIALDGDGRPNISVHWRGDHFDAELRGWVADFDAPVSEAVAEELNPNGQAYR